MYQNHLHPKTSHRRRGVSTCPPYAARACLSSPCEPTAAHRNLSAPGPFPAHGQNLPVSLVPPPSVRTPSKNTLWHRCVHQKHAKRTQFPEAETNVKFSNAKYLRHNCFHFASLLSLVLRTFSIFPILTVSGPVWGDFR